jgi:two-component system response regulator RegA
MPPAHAIVEQRFADGSGLDLIERLSAMSPGLSAVVVTRYPSVAAAVQAMRLGFRDYLPKPLDWERLGHLFDLPSTDLRSRGSSDTGSDADERPSLARAEWEHIQATLFACGGNISAAARRLHLHRRSLQRKLQRNAPP